jgi:hypothetical protein
MFNRTNEDTDDFKKKRDVEAEKMRRNNRDEIFSKRRNILTQDDPRQTNFDAEPSRKDRTLIVDERYHSEIETYMSLHSAFFALPTLWTFFQISSLPSTTPIS